MNVWQSIIIGLLQGLTEFLPVSSSGHMLLAGKIFDMEVSLGYEIMMHFATFLAVIFVMNKEVFGIIKNPLKKESLTIIVASVPTVIVVLLFKDFFEAAFGGWLLPYCFLLTAILLVACSLIKRNKKKKAQPTYLDALIIGTVQGFAVLPGLSRSGSTIATGMLLNNDKESATRFSFLLSLPIIFGSALIEIVGGGIADISFLPLLFGFISAFLAGVAALKFMIKRLLQSFDYFAIYLLALSIFLFLDMLYLHWL